MPKEQTPRQFRKGTKSCIECRERKLRCIPAADESQPCQNCEARGRKCVLQVHVGRSSEATGATSRDRIRQLEDDVASLWSVVREMRSERGYADDGAATTDRTQTRQPAGDSDSETSEFSPMNPPTHLQQLFDNDFLDSRGNDSMSSDLGSEKLSTAQVARARSRLQALMPPKEDVQALCTPAQTWINLYNAIFPAVNMFTNAGEMVARYEALQEPDANPISIASLLISVAITIVQKPPETTGQLSGIKDAALFVRNVTTAVEEAIVSNDTLAGTIEGIETIMLYIRLQLVRTQIRKCWLKMRHVIALAELIGLPRAAQRVEIPHSASPSSSEWMRNASKLESAALLWKSICTIDRVVGMMFNLPLGTSAYAFPMPYSVMSNGQVITQNWICYLANIGPKIQEIDEAYLSQRPETELLERVFKADQELRSLWNMTPATWWTLKPSSPIPDHLMQLEYNYLTMRAHLQLALRNGNDPQYTYSRLACLQACRAVSVRYVNLRGILPPAFFAGRVLDLQALTAGIYLLYNSQRPLAQQVNGVQNEAEQSSSVLVEQVLQMMDSVSKYKVGGDFGRQGAAAIRALRELLDKRGQANSQNLILRIPMLGKVKVNRHHPSLYAPDSMQQGRTQVTQPTMQYGQTGVLDTQYGLPGVESADLLSWSMDLTLDEFPPFPDESLGHDQWLSFNGFNGQTQTWS